MRKRQSMVADLKVIVADLVIRTGLMLILEKEIIRYGCALGF